jgi:hypothetical protein
MASAVNAAVQLASSFLGGLFAAHTARLHDAQNENDAAEQALVAFDADLQQIADAYNNGQLSQADALSALSAVDQQTYQFLRAQVGKVGTAWRDDYPHCDKSCTVGCCIYNQDLHPSILNAVAAFQKGSGSFNVRKVYGSKYGLQTREAYSLTIKAPAVTVGGVLHNPAEAVTGIVDKLLGLGNAVGNSVTSGSALANNTAGVPRTSPLVWLGLAFLGVLALFGLARVTR